MQLRKQAFEIESEYIKQNLKTVLERVKRKKYLIQPNKTL